MGNPSRPAFQKEGSASPCVISGVNLAWKNCTTLACAMGMDKSTLGRVKLTGCQVRDETNDIEGGTTIPQVAAVAAAHGVAVEQHVGSNVCTPWYAAYQNASGRGYLLQGNTQPDGRGNVNHAVWVNECTGGTAGEPVSCFVYDPWSSGPAWWSWAKVKTFAAALRPWGEGDARTLGPGKFYCLIFPDTEPHVHLKYGGSRTSPWPDHVTVKSPVSGRRVNVRTRPDRLVKTDIVATLPTGTPWTAWQKTNGARPAGSASRLWYGNQEGNRWIHDSGLIGEGGKS